MRSDKFGKGNFCTKEGSALFEERANSVSCLIDTHLIFIQTLMKGVKKISCLTVRQF